MYKVPLIIRDIDINRELFPEASFFESTLQLANLLSEVKPISKIEIEDRKNCFKICEDNIIEPFNYSNLSNNIRKIILD